jgi:hypothetical protein
MAGNRQSGFKDLALSTSVQEQAKQVHVRAVRRKKAAQATEDIV